MRIAELIVCVCVVLSYQKRADIIIGERNVCTMGGQRAVLKTVFFGQGTTSNVLRSCLGLSICLSGAKMQIFIVWIQFETLELAGCAKKKKLPKRWWVGYLSFTLALLGSKSWQKILFIFGPFITCIVDTLWMGRWWRHFLYAVAIAVPKLTTCRLYQIVSKFRTSYGAH